MRSKEDPAPTDSEHQPPVSYKTSKVKVKSSERTAWLLGKFVVAIVRRLATLAPFGEILHELPFGDRQRIQI
jgi:hypothetical protein